MFLTFPNFNLYSTPLLVLVSQGILFGVLLMYRYVQKRTISDFLLALLVFITCYHRTTYTIGFMDWYDTFRNTKVNYYLISLSLAVGPLIYFYVKSVTVSDFKFQKKDSWHFLPVLLYIMYRLFILIYDSAQPGFSENQNGTLMLRWPMGAVGTFTGFFNTAQQLLYLAFSLQLYFSYGKRIKNFFSNTYKLELNWLRNFLFVYTFLFLYGAVQQLVNISVVELTWIEKWWYQFFSALAVIYIGIKGFFTDTTVLNGLNFNRSVTPSNNIIKQTSPLLKDDTDLSLQMDKNRLRDYMLSEKPYLDANLNLINLANALEISRSQLSETINLGFGKNFNDFVNAYRVDAVKEMLSENKHKNLSLLGIAYECGFNSKATFNRVFKKMTGNSPTKYIKVTA